MSFQANQETVTNYELCQVMKKSGIAFTDYGKQQKVLSDFIVAKPLLENQISKEEETDLVKKVQTFLAHAIPKYKRDCCKFEQFLSNSKNRDFLRNDFPLPESLRIEQVQCFFEENSPVKVSASKQPKLGRKPVPFEEKSVRAKQYASAKVRQQHEPGAIILAASQQSSTLGHLVKKAKSPSGRTAGLALEAITSSKIPGTLL